MILVKGYRQGDNAVLEVKDDGVGMDEELFPIFLKNIKSIIIPMV